MIYSKPKLEPYEEFLKSNRPTLSLEVDKNETNKNQVWLKINNSKSKRLNYYIYALAFSCLLGFSIVFTYSQYVQKEESLSESDANLVLDSIQLNVFDDEDEIIWSAR